MPSSDRRPDPTSAEVEQFHDSLQRCTAGGRFYDRFYERFVAADPRIPALFKRTDMARQQRMLHHSFLLIMTLHLRDPDIDAQMRDVAHRHDGMGITEDLFDVWLEELLGAVAECDPRFDAAVNTAWRAVLGRGIGFVHAHVGPTEP